MTHDELLAQIDFLPLHGLCAWMQPALRAVVELHEPFDFTWGGETLTSCKCGEIYPCPTIQAIEKELQ